MNNTDNNSSEKKRVSRDIDPRFLSAVKALEQSFNNSRAYSDTINTEEKRLEQAKRIQEALDEVSYKESAAYCKAHKYRRH